MSYKFYQNKGCEFFPCHPTKDVDNFNCLFCYCPLYNTTICCQKRHCDNCLYPHNKFNYEDIVILLKDLYGHKKSTKTKRKKKRL